LALAQLTSVQINKASKKGKRVKPKELMAFANPWKELEDEIGQTAKDIDEEVRSAFAGLGRIIRVDRVTRQPI
jgi:hypothetical protein